MRFCAHGYTAWLHNRRLDAQFDGLRRRELVFIFERREIAQLYVDGVLEENSIPYIKINGGHARLLHKRTQGLF